VGGCTLKELLWLSNYKLGRGAPAGGSIKGKTKTLWQGWHNVLCSALHYHHHRCVVVVLLVLLHSYFLGWYFVFNIL
jgi:hypothetical protein